MKGELRDLLIQKERLARKLNEEIKAIALILSILPDEAGPELVLKIQEKPE